MKEALLEVEQTSPEADVKEKNSLNLIKDWLASDELFSELEQNTDFRFGGAEERLAVLKNKIENKRMELGVILPAEDIAEEVTRAEEYRLWDVAEANNIIERYNQQQEAKSKAEIEAIIPKPKPEEPTAEIVDMGHLADAELETIMPIETRTNAERYSDLVVKAEAKAREYEQKPILTRAETTRLEEIKADIEYFSERRRKAIAAERTPTVIREELIQLKERPAPEHTSSSLGDPEAVAAVEDTITTTPPEKTGWLSGFSLFGRGKETPPATKAPTRAEIFRTQPPPKKLGPVNSVNDGVRV